MYSSPLPPVPALDKRSQSIQQSDNYYEDGHLYDKPVSAMVNRGNHPWYMDDYLDFYLII